MGTAPPVTVYIRGPIKGYIKPYYNHYPSVTEGGQYPRLGFRVRGDRAPYLLGFAIGANLEKFPGKSHVVL